MSTATSKEDAVSNTVEAANGGEVELVPALLSIAKASRAFLTLLLAEVGLHPGQDQLLHALEPDSTVSVSVLADQLAVRPSTVSKMLDRLIERDLVLRSSSSKDARRTMVMLTADGVKARRAVHDVWSKLEAELKNAFSADEFEDQMRVLTRIDSLLVTKLRRLR